MRAPRLLPCLTALRQCWDTLNRSKYHDLQWSIPQAEALGKIYEGISVKDEDAKRCSKRWLYVNGEPGSGKSSEARIRVSI